ncbi:N(4)-(beta-N-acetylglucosaminyl)-L-asparaginase [Chitinophaga sp. sic0106]|uniref:N(4)-(beta-N-acetylglucosaminyl)-L-asparaginase n=1 Tax=Chitinophaga sp. sic0106 TaxID=2854785 RepID=UPI001C49730D|nr:N(4)-(beta-N-acetylglucosaminyl)-L-asparaginase [Chitinophaga sp. sic0106]MBV7531154.1 N(4)-(beta-N-acetylglucosaminyl)-L-asparaginase [Chitinophaga sp. sic0106]
MKDRRSFLKTAAMGAAVFSLDSIASAADAQAKKGGVTGKPIVVSTWDFGRAANSAAWDILKKGGRALDAVEAGVRVPEADPNNHTVGYSGFPDRDGRVTLDACIMDEFGNAGSVCALEHVTHAISVARKVMEKTPHVMLAGDGALQFALANGFEKENLLTPEAEKAWQEWLKKSEYKPVINIENKAYDSKGATAFNPLMLPGNQYNHDTIGMVAMDANGNLSGACTTSGMAFKLHGRVGDSPIIGAGLYVDNEIGAATSTGVGEEVIKIVGSHLVVELMRQGYPPEAACKEAVTRIVKRSPSKAKEIQVGFLALNKKGQVGAYCLQPGFSYAVLSNEQNNVLINGKSHFK